MVYHFSCRKDQFTVLSLKFGTQDFTLTGLSLWFCFQVFLVLEFPHANPKGRNGVGGLRGFSTPTFFRTNEDFAPGLIET